MTNSRGNDLKLRTKQFALDVIRFFASDLPQKRELAPMIQQLVRSASSVGANYRSACRARSIADFMAKLSIVEEESDEAKFWMELLEELGVGEPSDLKRLLDEADQLTAITVASKKTARSSDRLKARR